MALYMVNLAIVYLMSWGARYNAKPSPSSEGKKPAMRLVFFALISMMVIAGFRYVISLLGDEAIYRNHYVEIGNITSISELFSGHDLGFEIFCWLLNLISHDPQLMIFFSSLITNYLITNTISEHARPFELGMYLYITAGYFLTSFNIIRQYLAAALIFWAIRYIISGNWKKYFLVVSLAMTFHFSAIIMVPAYFLIRKKAWTWTTWFVLLGGIIIYSFFDNWIAFLFTLLENTQYSSYENDYLQNSYGVKFIRVVIYLVPVIIAFILRRQLMENSPESNYYVNFSILSLVIMFVSMKYVYIARLEPYFSLPTLLLIPQFIKVVDRTGKFIMYSGVLLCYFLFYYFELLGSPVYHNLLLGT